jgi:Holliday junction resolvase
MPETTRYARGRDAEYRIRNELSALGYQSIRTAGSHGWSDVIAWNERETRFIQSKTWKTERVPSFAAEKRKLERIQLPPYATAELWGRKIGVQGWTFKLVLNDTRPHADDPASPAPGSP